MIQNDWTPFLKEEFEKDYFKKVNEFVEKEMQTKVIYPPKDSIFCAFEYTEYAQVKVVLLGQDPYHQPNQAHGLCFSVQKGEKIPPSLLNMYKELQSDYGIPIASHGCLTSWTKQGVFLLNTILTVEDSKPLSHQGVGWEVFTDNVIKKINDKNEPVVFLLWGKNAQLKKALITNKHHLILEAPHPSPLSSHRGFFGSKPFSKTNEFLRNTHQTEINWKIEE